MLRFMGDGAPEIPTGDNMPRSSQLRVAFLLRKGRKVLFHLIIWIIESCEDVIHNHIDLLLGERRPMDFNLYRRFVSVICIKGMSRKRLTFLPSRRLGAAFS